MKDISKLNNTTESKGRKNPNYFGDSSIVNVSNNISKKRYIEHDNNLNSYREKMISLSKNIYMINRSNIERVSKKKRNTSIKSCVKDQNNNSHSNRKIIKDFFKSKTEYKSGILQNAQNELNKMKQSLFNSTISYADKSLTKKIMSLNKHDIDYLTLEDSDRIKKHNDTSNEDDKEKDKEMQITNISQSMTLKNDEVDKMKQFSNKLIGNLRKYRKNHQPCNNNQLSYSKCSNSNQNNHRNTKVINKQKIDVFELVKQINPKFTPFKKKVTPLTTFKTFYPEKKNPYPSQLLIRSICKHRQREKQMKTNSDNKTKKIAKSLIKLDEYIKHNLCSSFSNTLMENRLERNYSYETFISSKELITHIKTCRKIITN